ncbi:MAG: hypothetical protein HRT94_01805 [Alphaproteobacteria bacterium]|nr:hypothetical protein [Alphaproteobacteria bacterium]
MPFVNEQEHKRTIDHDRNIILRPFRNLPEGYQVFQLDYNGDLIEFYAIQKITLDDPNPAHIDWSIEILKIPDSLMNRRKEVKDVIVEAMMVFGLSYGCGDADETVNVTFDKRIT